MSPEEAMFQEALTAARSGERVRARDLFTRLLKLNQGKAEYWLWMSALVDTPRERTYCLTECLKRDPGNLAARRGLQMLGQEQPLPEQVIPLRVQKRNWQVTALPGSEERTPLPLGGWRQWALIGGAVIMVVALVGLAIAGTRQRQQARIVIPTDFPLPPTFTPMPSATLSLRSPTPEPFTGPTPLWMQLQATYTPTPLYVNTPHAISEAYRIAMRAFERGAWDEAESYLKQVVTVEPGAADALYYAGETRRLSGDVDGALAYYAQAVQANPSFAPSYLGRARAALSGSPSLNDMERAYNDLEKALELDPNLGEAYLELAAMDVRSGAVEQALQRLDEAERLLPNSPEAALLRGRAYLALDEPDQALESARTASARDFTSLPAYRLLAEALQAAGQVEESREPLQTYLTYVTDDPGAYVLAANAHRAAGETDAALESYSAALALDDSLVDAYLQRAVLYLGEEQFDRAIDDFERVTKLDKTSYAGAIGLGQALFLGGYAGDAYMQLERVRGLVESDAQQAELLFWEARALQALDENLTAYRLWQELLALPAEALDPAWAAEARRSVAALATRTPTSTATITATRTSTTAATRTVTRTPTRTRPAATPTPTP